MNKKSGKVKMSLRLKLAFASIITLCMACCFACLLVILGFYYIYDKPMTATVGVIMCLIVCALTMLIGGAFLWHEALYITNPIIKISEGVKKVTDGDFTVQLEFTKSHRKLQEGYYADEIDELAYNFNKMARELSGMDYMRKDFMSNVSHEIKTPVAAITGFSEILLDGGLSVEEQQEYLNYLNEESIRLSRLCENMLRMSRLDNQYIVEKKQKVQIDEQIRRCIIVLNEKWSEKNIIFDLQLERNSLLSDYDLLFQVWTNLIDNAIKYSGQDGTIQIFTGIDDGMLTVTIRDEGIGIAKEKQARIFDKFYQCDESHKKQGSGLGLSIVKRILELLEGTIELTSEEGKGTSMTVRIPAKQERLLH